MKTILYLSHGEGPHNSEAVYSLLTAFRFAPPPQASFQYVVYTDEPDRFKGLGLKFVHLNQDVIRQWRGDSNYVHRITTCAVIDALQRFSGSVIKVDADTYFRKSPALLFERTKPGASVMHVPEGRLAESRQHILQKIIRDCTYVDRSGASLVFKLDEMVMWNAGVIGVHANDLALLEETRWLTDQMMRHEAAHSITHVEQLATSYFLSRNRLSSCSDVIFHYWRKDIRVPFDCLLPTILAASTDSPLQERGARAYARRPRHNFLNRLKIITRIVLRRLGFSVPGLRQSF